MTTKISTTEARKHWSDIISRVQYGKEHIQLTTHGRVVAVLVPVEDINARESDTPHR